MSEILIVYYSRTGKTRAVTQKLAALLGADIEEIKEKKGRAGATGFLGAGMDTLFKRGVELTQAPSVSERKMVVIGMPIWAFQPPAPVRQYVRQTDLAGITVCAFCTSDGTSGKGAFKALNGLLPAPLAETFGWIKPKPDDPELQQALAAWAEKLKALTA